MKRNGYKAAIPIVSGIAYVPNPRMLPDLPVEVTVRSERIGTKTRELTPGVHVVAQISRTGKEVWITHGEQRLFLYLQDEQGRVSLFYQSFSGTGGKAQGHWFPSGGILADQRGSGVWVIKGNPKTDPGAGREGLLALYEKANAVLPQSDAETDAFVKKVTRVDYDDLMYKDEYEIQPTMKILEEGHANALQSKWNNWAYRFWALNALDKTFGKRTFNIKENPRDLEGRYIPDRYLAGLPPELQKQRIRELTPRQEQYKRGDFSELPTDSIARKMGLVKQSKYTTEAKKRGVEYRGNAEDMATRVLMVYSGRAPAQEVAAFAEALRKSFSKGLAAWKSGGHRPGASPQGWAIARVNSLVVGGKTSWTADKKLFAVLPEAVRSKIESMRTTPAPMRRNPKSKEVEELLAITTLGLTRNKTFVEYATGRLQKEAAKQKVITGSAVTQKAEVQNEFIQNALNAMLAALEPGGEKEIELRVELFDFLPLHRRVETGTVLAPRDRGRYEALKDSVERRLQKAYNRGVEVAKVEKEVEEVGGLSKYKLTRAACADHAKRKANALNSIRSQLFPPAESEYNIAQYAYADVDQSERLKTYQARKTLCEERPTRTTLYDVPHVESDAEDDVTKQMLALAATVDNLLSKVYTTAAARTDAEVRKKRAGLSALKLFMDRLHNAEFGIKTAEPRELLLILRQASRELDANDAKVLMFEVAEGTQRRLEGWEEPQLVERRQKVVEAKKAAPQITTSRSNRR